MGDITFDLEIRLQYHKKRNPVQMEERQEEGDKPCS